MLEGGHLAENVLHFARVLRRAGLPVGTDRPLLALSALEVAGIDSRADLRAVLEACLIDRVEHRPLFEEAFLAFWSFLEQAGTGSVALAGGSAARQPAPAGRSSVPAAVPDARSPGPSEQARRSPVGSSRAPARRIAEALGPRQRRLLPLPDRECGNGAERGGTGPSATDLERLRRVDFDTMTAAEWRAASAAAAALAPLLRRGCGRREAPASCGLKIDLRRLLRDSARHGGDITALPRRRRLTRLEPVIAIVDVSGSMSRYSRMFLHFLHALVNRAGARHSDSAGLRTFAFVFGTRLTAITRALRARDPDDAVSRVTRCVPDFSGGTRIGECLLEFNRQWAKRVPLSDATVLLVTDGLERSGVERLEREAARLARSCRRLLWLNPLLRYEGFEPQARGVRALLPHASALLPIHNLESLERLADILADAGTSPGEGKKWR